MRDIDKASQPAIPVISHKTEGKKLQASLSSKKQPWTSISDIVHYGTEWFTLNFQSCSKPFLMQTMPDRERTGRKGVGGGRSWCWTMILHWNKSHSPSTQPAISQLNIIEYGDIEQVTVCLLEEEEEA